MHFASRHYLARHSPFGQRRTEFMSFGCHLSWLLAFWTIPGSISASLMPFVMASRFLDVARQCLCLTDASSYGLACQTTPDTSRTPPVTTPHFPDDTRQHLFIPLGCQLPLLLAFRTMPLQNCIWYRLTSPRRVSRTIYTLCSK